MRSAKFTTALLIHACPNLLLSKVEDVLERFGVLPKWVSQELVVESVSGEYQIQLSESNVADLVSELYSLGGIVFELNQSFASGGVLYMGVPGLGVFRGDLNAAGSILLSEDRINQMIESAAGNQREFLRLLRVGLGQSWDDIIEPFRGAKFSDNVILLNRAG